MSGLTIPELLLPYKQDTVESVECLEVYNTLDGLALFKKGKKYLVMEGGVRADDGNIYISTLSKFGNPVFKKASIEQPSEVSKPEDSGGSCEYYRVHIPKPTTAISSYVAECNDVIETLGMTYAEANIFKEIWRSAAARTLGKLKAGHSEQRGAEKIEFFAKRNSIQKGVKQ